ncbi:MAG: ABC transporter ATP-binding protein [Desulfurococcales archaeon]|nr:ABC transporter ATP-binding protein [Desulfurococcales archaeon]
MQSNHIIETRGIVKTFGGLRALDGVDIKVQRGSLTLLIGPNGSGKTTLINVIGGVYKPDAGQVIYEGEDITGLPPHEIYHKGIVRTFQIPRLFKNLIVTENLATAKRGNPGENVYLAPLKSRWIDFETKTIRESMITELKLKILHMWNRKSSELSGGQMKLVEIGRSLMAGARLVLMDEPAAGVNPTLAHQIFAMLKEMTRGLGITFLIVEHRLEIAAEYADYVIAMARGKVISEGKPNEVMTDPVVVKSYLEG